MKPSHCRSGRLLFHVAAFTLQAAIAPFFAQTPTSSDRVANQTDKTATVQLSPFEVLADKNDSYEALNFSSLSGTNKSLDKLPVTAEVLNSTLMSDVGTSDIKDLLYNY